MPGSAFDGRPQIAIANTASDPTPCDMHLTEVAASVRNGVYEAGGIPLELTVDAEGNVWVAIWGPGELRCFSPAGHCSRWSRRARR